MRMSAVRTLTVLSLFLMAFLADRSWAQSPAETAAPLPSSLPWTQKSGTGVGIGLDSFGTATAEELDINVLVPVYRPFALRVRSAMYFGFGGAGEAVGGKLEAMLRSGMLLNFIRVYAGGGPALFYGLTGPNAGQFDGDWFAGDINGNWFAGAEIFFDPRMALHWELGTNGGAFGTGAGPYVDVGLEVYPFRSGDY
ncbi:MAG: hypothetical protein ACLQMF_14820 [Rectinemataceae bacterium]